MVIEVSLALLVKVTFAEVSWIFQDSSLPWAIGCVAALNASLALFVAWPAVHRSTTHRSRTMSRSNVCKNPSGHQSRDLNDRFRHVEGPAPTSDYRFANIDSLEPDTALVQAKRVVSSCG